MAQIIEVIERYEMPDIPNLDLPEEDGVPLESNWHRLQMNLLIENVTHYWREREDFFVGGNMFVYYSVQQARNRDYKGPDFLVVKDIDGRYARQKWVVWEENGRYPDVIVELMSPSTAKEDLGSKKDLYERTFHTSDYFCYDPDEQKLIGWHLGEAGYEALKPDDQGRLWSGQLEAWIGRWEGAYIKQQDIYLRLFDQSGQLIPIEAEAAQEQAKVAQKRANAAPRTCQYCARTCRCRTSTR